MSGGAEPRRPWTHDESVAVLALYVQIPFGTMHRGNPRVIELAQRIGRTPSSVALKLANFASLDPAHRERGVIGMGNVAALDREVWAMHYGNWESLASHAVPDNDREPNTASFSVMETEQPFLGTARRGQAFFRSMVLAAYNEKCGITGIAAPGLLRASHIVPWSERVDTRLDPHNGLCLNALHDCAFDQGLMTIDESLRVVYARQIWEHPHSGDGTELLRRFDGARLEISHRFRPLEEYLDYHRTRVFVA